MSFYLGKIRIVLSYPLAVIMTAVILADTTQSVLICFISALLHEAGHLLVMKYYGITPKEIKMSLFDIAIVAPKKKYCGVKQGIAIDLAGVGVNLLCGLLLLIVYAVYPQKIILIMISSHLTLFLFNILPIETLDGGHALSLFLAYRLGEEKADKIIMIVSVIFIVPLAVVGFLVLLRSKYNFTLLLSGMYLIAVLLKRFSIAEYKNKRK